MNKTNNILIVGVVSKDMHFLLNLLPYIQAEQQQKYREKSTETRAG
jgi:hypothetical protein